MASSDRTLQPRLPTRAFASAARAGVVARRQRGLLGRSTGGRDDDGQVTPNAQVASVQPRSAGSASLLPARCAVGGFGLICATACRARDRAASAGGGTNSTGQDASSGSL